MQTLSPKNIVIALMLGLLHCGFIGRVHASVQEGLADYTTIILQKINEARANPRLAMERLGISEQTVEDTLGNDAWIINQGLPPLVRDTQLQTAAFAHGRDMLANGYFSYASLSGLTPDDRIAATGYQAEAVDETMAALGFDYYLEPAASVDGLIDNMLRDELTGVPGINRNIFSTTLSEVGIAFITDNSSFLSESPYVYLLVLDFGIPTIVTPAELTDEAYLIWQKINEARANPRLALDRLAIPENEAGAILGSDAWILDSGLPPLAWNDKLQSAAQDHNRDMFTNVYYGHVSSTGLDAEARIDESGYEALQTGETMALKLSYSGGNADTLLDSLVDDMLREELTGINEDRNIFSPDFTEVGLGLRVEKVVELTGEPYVYLLVVDFASPIEDRSFVVGQIDTGYELAIHQRFTDPWNLLDVLPGGLFQFQQSPGGEDILYWQLDNPEFIYSASTRNVTENVAYGENYFIDLRSNSSSSLNKKRSRPSGLAK